MKHHLLKAAGLTLFVQMVGYSTFAVAKSVEVIVDQANQESSTPGYFSIIEKPPLKLKPIKQSVKETPAAEIPLLKLAMQNVAEKPAEKSQENLPQKQPVKSTTKSDISASASSDIKLPVQPLQTNSEAQLSLTATPVMVAKPVKTEIKVTPVGIAPTTPAQIVKKSEPIPAPNIVIKLKKGDNIHAILEAAAKENHYALNWEGEELYSKYEASFESASFDKSVDSLLIAIKVNGYISGNVIYVVVK